MKTVERSDGVTIERHTELPRCRALVVRLNLYVLPQSGIDVSPSEYSVYNVVA
jgi:hypothetical protein